MSDASAVVVERPGRSVSVPGPDDSWMDDDVSALKDAKKKKSKKKKASQNI